MLSLLKLYLRKRGTASLQEIAIHLNSPVEAVEGMLQTLKRKGSVQEQKLKSACGTSCAGCDSAATRYFSLLEEVDNRDRKRPMTPPPDCTA